MTTFASTLATGLLPIAAGFHIGSGLGGLLFLIGWIWLMTIAFPDHVGWGLLVLLLPGLGGIIYGAMRWPATMTPLILLLVGMLLGGGFLLGSGPLIHG